MDRRNLRTSCRLSETRVKKTVGRKLLSLDEMTMMLKECEAIVNPRPLVNVGSDLKSSIAISPRHFISLNPYTGIPDSEYHDSGADYVSFESNADKLLKHWKKVKNC